jgi:hypothetical protein
MAENELKNLLSPCSDGDLASIIRRARELGELTDALSRALPDDCAGAVVAANLREDGNLVVIAASSAWASRLRYEADTLLAAARAAGLNPVACRVRVSQT